jgi:mRNA interferase HigB
MRIISKNAIKKFWGKHSGAEQSLLSWHKIAKSCTWNDFSDVRKTFRNTDVYRDCVIFDVGGNKYRVIAKIRYRTKRIYIRFVLTHSEYGKGSWKEDCEC